MRDEQTWKKEVEPQLIDKFPKRLARDMRQIPYELSKIKPPGSYYMHGPVGTGKTLWAAWMFLEVCKSRWLIGKPMDVRFMKVSEFFEEIKVYYGQQDGGGSSAQNLVRELSDCYCLIFDDFGSERPSDWAISLLYLVMDRRYENDRMTIITSNLSLEEAAENLGDDRITARIERMCKIINKKRL